MEPEWFLAKTIGGPFYRIPQLLAPALLVMLARPAALRAIDPPFALFLMLHVTAVFYAENRGYVIGHLKTMFYIFATCVAVITFANTPARIVTLLKIYLLSLVWYGVQGLPNGLISWHPLMGNEDSYGPLMVIGVGLAFNFAAGTRSRLWRWISYGTVLLGCVGVVSSFARGAVLSLVAVIGLLWLRAQHKVRTLLISAVAGVVTLVAINVLFPQGAFWAEMKTIAEGTEGGTGQTRWVSWGFALEIFTHHPILGVGAGNFGVVAFQEIPHDTSRAIFTDPSMLYNFALHNVFVQILCEEGIAGFLLFLWMTYEFLRRLRWLRSAGAVSVWRGQGGDVDLRSVSLGLELAMIAFLINAFFYNQLYIHWFWTLITLAYALTRTVTSPRSPPLSRARTAAEPCPMQMPR